MQKLSGVLVVLLTLAAAQATAFPQQKAQPKAGQSDKTRPPKTEQHAVWTLFDDTYGKITKEDFDTLGLARLTPDQMTQLVVWSIVARANDVTEHEASLRVLSCADEADDPSRLNKLRVFTIANDTDPAEIISEVRQRLRNVGDIEIVFSDDSADIALHLLAYQNRNVGGQPIGYTLSMVTTEPCQIKLNGKSYSLEVLKNNYLQTAATADELAQGAVVTLDTSDFEETRKVHAAMKSFLEQQKASKPQ